MPADATAGNGATTDVLVVGAGVIGAATAWRCAQGGLSVTIVDPEPGRGAWHTAAGMLAPVTELHFTETPLLHLNLDSLGRWPAFAAELVDETHTSIGLRECGTVAVAWDAADLAGLRDLHAFSQQLGVDVAMVTGRELRELEPAVAPGLPGGLLAAGDHQVDPRLLHAALMTALSRRGVRVLTNAVTITTSGDRVIGAQLDDGTQLSAGQVVLAAGCWSGRVPGLPANAIPAVRPVKGQTLRLRLPGPPRLQHVLRGSVKGTPIYLVPRADGRIVVGASSEEAGFDRAPRAGAVYELLRDAQSLLPDLSEAVLDEVCTGLRPGSPDNAPLVGPSGVPGLIHATGHFRNGILLTPVTADGVAQLMVDGTLPAVLEPFAPQRFTRVPA
ncbi:MAG: glycine oxidase ThiO [Jatrophihabitans sp.]